MSIDQVFKVCFVFFLHQSNFFPDPSFKYFQNSPKCQPKQTKEEFLKNHNESNLIEIHFKETHRHHQCNRRKYG